MTADEAVKVVTEYVRDTGTPAAEAVKNLWEQLKPITDSESLIQFAIATRVAVQYRRPGHNEASVSVTHERYKLKEYEVTVTILRDTMYNVNGKVKSVAVCNRHDVLTLAENARKAEEGFSHYRKVWEYAAQRLQTLKKDKIEDMGHGEQMKLARMLNDCQRFRLPNDLKSLPPTG